MVVAGRASLQDLGRHGAEQLGLSVNGAADQLSAMEANALVGNGLDAVVLELLVFDVELLATSVALVAVAGAEHQLTVGGRDVLPHQPVVVLPGERVRVHLLGRGARCYLAVNGGFAAPRLLGSAAPDPIVGFGDLVGVGDRLPFRSRFGGLSHPFSGIPLFRFPRTARRWPAEWVVEMTAAPVAGGVADPDVLCSGYVVDTMSDHVGLRLGGAALLPRPGGEPVSRGVPVGAVEVPPSGQPIVLLRGRLVTAGYPVAAVVTTSSLALLGQARPGQRLTFRWQERGAAVLRWRRDLAQIADLADAVARCFTAVGLGEVLVDRMAEADPVRGVSFS